MDINELAQISTAEAHRRAFLKDLTDAFARFSKLIIAAVIGVAVRTLRHACRLWMGADWSDTLDVLGRRRL